MGDTTNQGVCLGIRFLNKMGYPVVEIQGRYYIVSLFEEASNTSWKHQLEGKEVTTIISGFTENVTELTESHRLVVLQKIEGCVNVKKYFHKDIVFVLHLQ